LPPQVAKTAPSCAACTYETASGQTLWKVYGPDLDGRYGSLQGTGGLEATILDAGGATQGVVNDQFGNGVATVSGGSVSWNATRVGAYGPLPGTTASALTDITQLAAATAWRGRRIDPTGFYDLGARYYDPTSGRFLSADPLGNTSSTSLYDFAGGDPVNFFDPTGRCNSQTNNNPPGPSPFGPLPNFNDPIDGGQNPADPNSSLIINSPSVQDAINAINANLGLKIGQMNIASEDQAQAILFALGLDSNGYGDVFRAKLAIYAISDPVGYQQNALRLSSLSFGLASLEVGIASSISYPGGMDANEGSLLAEQNGLTQRQATAYDSFQQAGFNPAQIQSHMAGIDFNNPVEAVTVPSGQPLSQFNYPGSSGGNYYTDVGSGPSGLGIYTNGRVETVSSFTTDVQALRSTAATTNDTWSVPGLSIRAPGGSSQYFIFVK
jgi:RHS repeat-associated protein